MIHYHGTPVGGSRVDASRFLSGRHALVSFAAPDDMPVVADVCQSFVLDNGAFSAWKRGIDLDAAGYLRFVEQWRAHPGCDWALIPDVIDGDEADNDAYISAWPVSLRRVGVPVWHLHESLERLQRLAAEWPTVALGSSGQWPSPGNGGWWGRMAEVMDAVCDNAGRPACRLHGLRMLDPRIFTHLPLASADSTNAAVNCMREERFGIYPPPTKSQRADVIAARVEAHNSAPCWAGHVQDVFELGAA